MSRRANNQAEVAWQAGGGAGAKGPMTGLALAALIMATPLHAQTFRGRVIEGGTDAPVSTALVTLLDDEGEEVGVSIADSAGVYRIGAQKPGVYRLRAERIGYETVRTPLLEAGSEDGTYPVDIVLRTAPYELPGFTVEAERVSDEEADREIRLMIGLDPASLRYGPVDFETIQDHVAKAHTLTDLMRWRNYAGLVVSRTTDGPCFSLRGRGCLPVYLNGLPLRGDFVEGLPLDMIYRIVVLTPTDGTFAYGGGAVLLYTEAWLR